MSNSVPIVSMTGLDAEQFAANFGGSFARYGFAMVSDHGIDDALIQRCWAMSREFFALSEEEKRRYHIPALSGARGYTPFGTEIAKGAAHVDLKEFWHVGRDLPPGHPLGAQQPNNVWPTHPAQFRETFEAMNIPLRTLCSSSISFLSLGSRL